MTADDLPDILPSVFILDSIRPKLAAAAQKVYDAWEQDEDGMDEELGPGGICHLIADAMVGILFDEGIETAQTVSATDEVHVYVVAVFDEGVFQIDIPYRIYESGGGYTWLKIPNVRFQANDVTLYCLDINPKQVHLYTEE